MVKALVLTGDGINCERETKRSLDLAGFSADIVLVNDLIENKSKLIDYQVLCLPGGFSFGDDLGSGRLMALKLEHYLKAELQRFFSEDRLTIGICNGFQILAEMKVFDNVDVKVRLKTNISGEFQNQWLQIQFSSSASPWLKRVSAEPMWVPIRHGEGRVWIKNCEKFSSSNLACQYLENINGSYLNAAGLFANEGKVLGLMPHPEICVSQSAMLDKKMKPRGLELFRSAFEYFS